MESHRVTTREEVDPLPSLKKTLREHYERKRSHYGIDDSHSTTRLEAVVFHCRAMRAS